MVEEIPSGMQTTAIHEFEKLITAELEKLRVMYEEVRSYISPRRMVFSAKLNPRTEEFIEEKKGPQATASSEIIEKFTKANNVSIKDCIYKEVDKKTFVFITIKHESRDTSEVLSEAIKNAIEKIQWKKSMRWGNYQFHFVRPLRNIMAVLNGNPLDVKFEGIDLKSNNYIFGHRFLAPAKMTVNDVDEYLEKMRNSFVIVDSNERKRIILSEFRKLESSYNISIDIDERLLDEVIGLVEYPVVLLGKIPKEFMDLPEEAITTPLRIHQRYFSTRINEKLAPYFVFVANNIAEDGGKTIIAGNEKVLNARLADALFFFKSDLDKSLESRLEELKKIAFNDRLGTVFDRVNRMVSVCDYMDEELEKFSGNKVGQFLKRAAILAKCDLASSMVCEFPELQGIMGAHYAKIQGETSEICEAIRDQYRPIDEITNYLSALLSLADKIELMIGLFAIGKEPTGSKDPFAMRRAAIGILKIIKNFNIRIDLKKILQKTFNQLPKTDSFNSNTIKTVYGFILDRLKIILKESGIRSDVAGAVVNDQDDLLVIFQKSEALNNFLQNSSGERLLSMHKRIKNIVLLNKNTYVNKKLFVEREEVSLEEKVEELEKDLREIEKKEEKFVEKFNEQLYACTKIEKFLFDFFDKVLVNTDNEQIKQNRLNLLTKLSFIFDTVIPNWQ
jgi:glycyl-tRNA synthetase beta chain